MELIKFDEDYFNIRHIIAIEAPAQDGQDKWYLELKTDAHQYPCYRWEFSSKFEAEQEFKKIVDKFRV